MPFRMVKVSTESIVITRYVVPFTVLAHCHGSYGRGVPKVRHQQGALKPGSYQQ